MKRGSGGGSCSSAVPAIGTNGHDEGVHAQRAPNARTCPRSLGACRRARPRCRSTPGRARTRATARANAVEVDAHRHLGLARHDALAHALGHGLEMQCPAVDAGRAQAVEPGEIAGGSHCACTGKSTAALMAARTSASTRAPRSSASGRAGGQHHVLDAVEPHRGASPPRPAARASFARSVDLAASDWPIAQNWHAVSRFS